MKLTYSSLQLIPFFLTNKDSKFNNSIPKKNSEIMEILFQDILQASYFLKIIKKKMSIEIFDITIKNIINLYQIPKPKNFNFNSFPPSIRKHIHDNSLTEICYTFSLFDRVIKLYFIVEETSSKVKLIHYQKYVDTIILWLFIVNKYSSKKCSKYFTVYFYFTSLTKILPSSNIDILQEEHVNTAFTTTCSLQSEIVIYRKEEWLKVFIHETFHNFGFDFSDINSFKGNKFILELFPVDSEVNLYESYTEFWAELMNACFCSYYMLKEKENFDLFLYYFDYFIDLERKFSCFQMVKVLDFMGLNYQHLFSNDRKSQMLRNNLYREKTNVLSYYIIKTILLYNYQIFLKWCYHNNNNNLLQFKKTETNLLDFCNFILQHYQSKPLITTIKEMEKYLNNLKKDSNIKKNGKKMVLENLRMSICELG
jgi:hypothetical protein